MKRGGLTAKLVEEKLREYNGNMAAVARALGVHRVSVWTFCNRRPSLMAISAECREAMKDNAESALQRAVLAGEAWAVCFYLKCQAKDRGYVERTEVTGADGKPFERVEVVRQSESSHTNGRAVGPHTPSA